MMIDIINDLHEKKIIQEMYKRGLIPAKVLEFRHIVNYFNAQRSTGTDKAQAITDTAENFKCSEQKVYRALRTLGV